ncbi:MAG: glycosyltransferase [Planctomycetota bacterium]|nr:glycosyltransferase [Planctomycetota bacterium]
MRVGIDYLPAATHWPGSGRYARELVRALVGLEERPDLRLFDVGRAERRVDPRALGLPFGDPRVVRVTRSIPRRALPFLARIGFDAARILGGIDVFHHVNVHGPAVRHARQVLAIAELPEPRSPAADSLRDLARRQDALIVFSADWRLRVAEQLDFPLARVHATSVGCEHWRRTLSEIPAPDAPPRILVLGATRTERRPLAVLRAFERLRENGLDARLAYVGRDGAAEPALAEALRASPAARHVARIRDAAESDLPALVAGASVLVHLDPRAGTPVTPLEALAAGVPVVASRIPCFREHLEGVAELVDDAEAAREPAYLAGAIAQAIAARTDGLELARRTAHARAYTWERCATETLRVWTSVAARP